jgi:hypothetical protein
MQIILLGAGKLSRYSDWRRAGRSGDRIPVGARFSAPVQNGPGAHPASFKMGTRSFQGVKSGRGVTLTLYPLLVPWSWKGTTPLWTVRPAERLSACTRVHFPLNNIVNPCTMYLKICNQWFLHSFEHTINFSLNMAQ